MDKQLIAERFSKASGTYTHEAAAQQQIAAKMMALLKQHISAPCRRIVEFGCGTGIYSRMLLRTYQPETFLLNDLCPEMGAHCKELLNEQVCFRPGDAETEEFPNDTDLITSCSTLQWFDAPEAFFGRCHRFLKAKGYFAFTTFGPENMKEIRELTGHGLSYPTCEALEQALAPLYHPVHVEEEVITLSFDTPMQVLYHLKQTGVTGTTHKMWTRSDLHQFCEAYTRLFGSEESVSLTYHPIYIIAKKR